MIPKRPRGQLAHEKGKTNERRVVEAINTAKRRGKSRGWLGVARLATPEEDARGVDVVVDSTVGPLYLQVKSSELRAEQFEKRGMRRVGVVVASGGDSEVRGRALLALGSLHGEIMRKKTGYSSKREPEVDLHGLAREDAVVALDRALNRLFMEGVTLARVICGYGHGVLLRAIGTALLEHPLVESAGPMVDRASFLVTITAKKVETEE